MRLSVLVLLLSALLSGCTALKPRAAAPTPLVKPPADAAEAVLIARDLARRDRWSAAIAMLRDARERFPGERELVDEQQALERRWAYEKQRVDDEILVGDAENQGSKIMLLGRLSRLDPDDLILTSRRLYWREVLAAKLASLTRCAETHVERTPELSRRCHALATMLAADEAVEARLAAVQARLRASEQEADRQRRVQQAKERQARAKVLLDEARAATGARDYRRALDVLAQVERLQPDNAEVAGLKEEAWSMISPQVEALVKLGDHLYLDEQLEAAVATWQAALDLKPDDEGLKARIERARTVLDRLDELRRRQQAVPGGTEPGGE